jgi:hypothetical protein
MRSQKTWFYVVIALCLIVCVSCGGDGGGAYLASSYPKYGRNLVICRASIE